MLVNLGQALEFPTPKFEVQGPHQTDIYSQALFYGVLGFLSNFWVKPSFSKHFTPNLISYIFINIPLIQSGYQNITCSDVI